MTISREQMLKFDETDPVKRYRSKFKLPEKTIYMDGNSLGALPIAAIKRIQNAVEDEWGRGLITSWLGADWVTLPHRIGDKIASFIGAEKDEVTVCDSTSVNLFKALCAALHINDDREIMLSEKGNFPTDLYIMNGIENFAGQNITSKIVEPEQILDAINEDVAVLLLTQVHYKTGVIRDMAEINRRAHEVGVLVVWDLSHSAGAIPLDLNASEADFAVGCGYKFFNGGPGAPAFIYVAKRHQNDQSPVLSGWFGHQDPFLFTDDYAPANDVRKFLCGTPPVLALTVLEIGVDIFCEVDQHLLRKKAQRLGALFITLMQEKCGDYGFEIISPVEDELRGGHVSLSHENSYEIMQAVKAMGLIGDFREPDVMRFGITPLYLKYEDIYDAVGIIETVMKTKAWDNEEFRLRADVT